jgi:hypothetical protein
MDFHCVRHLTFQSVCAGCQQAKKEYWLEQVRKPDEESLPVTAPRPALARNSDPITSHMSAAEMTDERTTNLHNQILEALRTLGVATRRMIWDTPENFQGNETYSAVEQAVEDLGSLRDEVESVVSSFDNIELPGW